MSYFEVLELSQQDAYQVDANGVYWCNVPSTIIRPMESATGWQILLNAPSQDDTNVYIDPAEQAPTIAFSYYDVDYDKTDKVVYDKGGDWPDATYSYYAGYNNVSYAQVTNIVIKINGFWKPSDEDGNPEWDIPGGSFIPSAPWVQDGYGNIDPKISFYATFSYIDEFGQIGYLTCTNYPNTQKIGNLYGMMSGSETTVASGVTLEDGWLAMIPCNSDRTARGTFPTIKEGSMQLVKVEGGWAGAFMNDGGKRTYPSNDEGDQSAGSAIAGSHPQEFERYDLTNGEITNRYKLSQFGLVQVQTTGSSSENQLDVKVAHLGLEVGATYSKSNLAKAMTKQLTDALELQAPVEGENQKFAPNNPLITRTDDALNTDMFFRLVDFSGSQPDDYEVEFNNDNSYFYYDSTAGQTLPYVVGAQVVDIEYDQTTDAFSIPYFHTPMQQVGSPNNQLIAVYHTGDPASNNLRYHPIATATGCIIHDMQPRSFWQDLLGLANKAIVPLQVDVNGVRYYRLDDMTPRVTRGYMGLDAFPIGATEFRKQPVPPADNPVYLDVTGVSKGIDGENKNPIQSGGGYLVKLHFNASQVGAFKRPRTMDFQVASIVSNYNENNGIITGYAESSIPFTNYSDRDIIINRIGVEILSLDTRQPDPELGTGNRVFLKIGKNIQSDERA